MKALKILFTLNGREVETEVGPGTRLLELIRDAHGLTGAKDGCGAGECGACTVLVNGATLKSCLMPAPKVQGAEVTTIEGLVDTNEFQVLARAFQQSGASQCGYCIPGIVVSAIALLRRRPEATREEIAAALSGNICRCTGYWKILDGVELSRDVLSGRLGEEALGSPPGDNSVVGPFVGANVPRVDGLRKIAGNTKYAADLTLPGMHHVKVLRSPVAHARIAELDVSRAEAMEGVSAVVTHLDVPGIDGYGLIVQDQPVLAPGRVRFVGEGIAAVAAETPEIARRAIDAIQLRLEELPAVFDAEQALGEGAPLLHESYPGNVVKRVKVRKGDLERGFAASDLTVEGRYTTQCVEHVYLEPEAALAYFDEERVLTIVSPSQNISQHRWVIAKIMGLPTHRVRMIMSPMGGGFGGKEDMGYQAILALAVFKANRPLKLVYSREESFLATPKRHPAILELKTGLKNDGSITACRIRIVLDGGAYGTATGGVVSKGGFLAAGPYAIENVQVDSVAAFTNNTPSGAMRTYGGLQVHFGMESHLDVCAAKLGMDPIALRRRNAMEQSAETHTGQRLERVSIQHILDTVEKAARWHPGPPNRNGGNRPDLKGPGVRGHNTLDVNLGRRRASDGNTAPGGLKRGRGVAAGWYGIALTGIQDRSGAWVELEDGGTAKVVAGASQTGEGVENVFVQIAADELGILPEDIVLSPNDTAIIPEKSHAGGSRQTYVVGGAVVQACREARAKLEEFLAGHWAVDRSLIRFARREVRVVDRRLSMSVAKAVELAKRNGVVPIGSGSYVSVGTPADPETGQGEPWQAYVFGAQIAEVEVDTVTGEVQVLGLWACHDIGRVVNPKAAAAQIEGAVSMAVGQALMEDYRLVEGRALTPNMTKYIVPTTLDVPQVNSILLENPDPKHPIGVRNIGEPAMLQTVPAIINAIFDAVGVRVTSLPATPEKVLMAIKNATPA
ncbi:MAG: molybdopterin cofactor-binding domain-containing protein [bacterium]